MQPKQIHELLDNFYKRPIEAVELVKKMLVSNDESTFSVWVENEKSNKFDSACDVSWPLNNLDINHPSWPHLTIFCNTCGIVNSSPICLSCFMRSNSNHSHSEKNTKNAKEESKIKNENSISFKDLNIEPHQNHDVYFKFIPIGHCSCGDKNSMNKSFFCSYHSLQPTNPPNIEIFGSDHCDFITDLTDICFRSLIMHAPHSIKNVECIVNFLLELTQINSSYLHLIAAALSENFDSSALFTHWPQFLTQNAVLITKLIEVLSVDDSFQYAFATSFYDNYIYILSYDLNILESFNSSSLPTSAIPLLAAADVAWGYFINNEEMIEDFSIAELIGKEFYILTSFVRSDPFHPIVSHSLIRNFFNTMNIFFSSSSRFFKTLTSPDSISKITDIFVDALSLETFPIVTKKFNFYDFDKFNSSFKFMYGCTDDDLSFGLSRNEKTKDDDSSNNEGNQIKKIFSSSDDLSFYFNDEELCDCDKDTSKKAEKYSPERHLILQNYVDKVDPKYQFMRCALKLKKNLFCAIEHLSDLLQTPELFIMPLLCGMIKIFFSTMSPDQFTFQNDFLSTITGPSFGESSSSNDNDDISDSEKTNITTNSTNQTNNPTGVNTGQNQSGLNINNIEDDSVTVNNLLKLQLDDQIIHKKQFNKPKNALGKIHFTHYYESKEPFYFRSVLDDLPLISCSAPCHSVTFRKFCKYSTNGIEDWRKAIKEANVYEIMFSNSTFLRSTFKSKTNKDIENELDQGIKLYLEDIALLSITIIPMRICALSSLLSLKVTKVNQELLKQELIKSKKSLKNIPYDRLLRSIFPKKTKNVESRKTKKTSKSGIHKDNNNNNNSDDDLMNDIDDDDDEDYDDYEYDDDDYDCLIGGFNNEDDDDDENHDSNDLYYNLFLKYADFSYDIIGSYAGSICALSFASNIGYLSLVTYCIFDLKNGITSRKLFAYLNFLICCISDRAVYAKDDEKLCWFFIRNLLSKRGKLSGTEILNECDKFFTKKKSFSINDNKSDYYDRDQVGVDDLLFEENDYEDSFIENRMHGKQVDDLDSFELLSGKSHSFCKKITDRFPRPIINRIINELAEPVYRFESSADRSDFNQIVFKLRDEFKEFRPSIFNTAQESFDQWSVLIQKHPIDAFLKLSFDNDYKPNGFSPQSVLLTSEFYSILFITALEATNIKKNGGFDKETIHIYFAILNYINQLNVYFDFSNSQNQTEIKNINSDNINDLISSVPSAFSQFQKTPIKFKDYPETTFNDLLLKFGEIGEYFNHSFINSTKREEKAEKPDRGQIINLYRQKRMNYLNPFVEKFKIDRYFGVNKSDSSTNFLITLPILIFDGFSGRQIWTSASCCNQIHEALTKMTDSSVFHCTPCGRHNAWIPANFHPNFLSLKTLVDDHLSTENFIDTFINQFGSFSPEKNLFNIIQNTIENVELRFRSNPFVIDDARPGILLGNSFRALWAFVQKIKFKFKFEKSSEEKKKVETIFVNRTFNYRNNELWKGSGMSDASLLTPRSNKLTLLLALLLFSDNPSESFTDLLDISYKSEKNDDDHFSVDFNGFTFVVENFNEETAEKNDAFDEIFKDEFANFVFLRRSFIVACCCLWIPFEKLPSSLFDPRSESAISDLYSLLFKKKLSPAKFFIGLDYFSFVDLPCNFFGFHEFPFAAEILNNNVVSITTYDNSDKKKLSSSPFDFEYNIKNIRKSQIGDDGNDDKKEKDSNVLIRNDKYLENKQMKLIKSNLLEKLKMKMKMRKIKFFACCEAVDLLNGNVGDFDTLRENSDSNCSILISLSGKDAGLCYAYNKSLNIDCQIVESLYLTLFGETGIKSGEILYLKKDRVLKLQDSFLSGELFL